MGSVPPLLRLTGDSVAQALARAGKQRDLPRSITAVDARRRHQGGEAVEQLQRRQAQRAVAARTGFVAFVEQAFGTTSAHFSTPGDPGLAEAIRVSSLPA
jgi:hypothetical protein